MHPSGQTVNGPQIIEIPVEGKRFVPPPVENVEAGFDNDENDETCAHFFIPST
jgi:hypothetical protein